MTAVLSPISRDLFQDQDDLLAQLREAGETILSCTAVVSAYQTDMDVLEAQIVVGAGGWAGLGKNDGERKYALTIKLNDSEKYRKAKHALAQAEYQLQEAKSQQDFLQRALNGNGYKMRLYAAEILATSTVRMEVPALVRDAVEELDF